MEIPTIDQIHIVVVVVVGVIITMVIVVVVTIIQETIIITVVVVVVVGEVDGRIIFVAKINLNNNNNTTLISSKIAITNEICHDHDRRPMTNDVVIDRRRLLEWRERERHDLKKVGGLNEYCFFILMLLSHFQLCYICIYISLLFLVVNKIEFCQAKKLFNYITKSNPIFHC
jgi:hypothetical protein